MKELTLSPPATEPVSSTPPSVPNGPSIDEGHLPPRGGLPLGTVLGVAISLLVALLLGGLTAVQLHREERRELEARQGLLDESLAPLASEIERSSSLGEISQHLSTSARAEIARGHSSFNLTLSDGNGRVVDSALTGTGRMGDSTICSPRVEKRPCVSRSQWEQTALRRRRGIQSSPAACNSPGWAASYSPTICWDTRIPLSLRSIDEARAQK